MTQWMYDPTTHQYMSPKVQELYEQRTDVMYDISNLRIGTTEQERMAIQEQLVKLNNRLADLDRHIALEPKPLHSAAWLMYDLIDALAQYGHRQLTRFESERALLAKDVLTVDYRIAHDRLQRWMDELLLKAELAACSEHAISELFSCFDRGEHPLPELDVFVRTVRRHLHRMANRICDAVTTTNVRPVDVPHRARAEFFRWFNAECDVLLTLDARGKIYHDEKMVLPADLQDMWDELQDEATTRNKNTGDNQ